MKLDPRAFADLLIDYCLEVAPGEQVLVATTSLAAPLALEVQRAVLERDAWPLLRIALPGQSRGFYEHARGAQIDGVAPLAWDEARGIDRRLRIDAPAEVAELAGVDPALVARHARASAGLREELLSKRWCVTLWPTPAAAARADMEVSGLEAFVTRALFLDRPDPVVAWGELSAFQARLIERLASAREIRVEADGTDLTLGVAGRAWVNSDGRRNMPSGEVFTGPIEDSADGRVRFDVPTGPAGVEVRGVELELRDGEVVSATAEVGQDHLDAVLATDDGARRLGELGIGTNFGIDRSIGSILFDEKIGGTVHLALGRSYPETGAVNASAIHWDLICDLRRGGRITADGEVVQEDGRFVV
ncbi:MAG TPA: aminopeptidase [Solirubrobacteraceae bacterium]|nr:aminopeptidase [Solirubrobacteraceae bacterium]